MNQRRRNIPPKNKIKRNAAQVARIPLLPAAVPRELPKQVFGYSEIYRLFLKHAFSGGQLRGNLFEVGAFDGRFMDFLLREPFFVSNGRFRVSGIDASPVAKPSAVMGRTTPGYIEEVVAENPRLRGKADFVIAKNVLDEPGCNKKGVFHAISLLAKKGAKVFLQTNDPKDLPSRDEIRKEGFRIAEVKSNVQGDREELKEWGLKKGQVIWIILVLQKVR